MITHDRWWSLTRGNTLVPSRWQATAKKAPAEQIGGNACAYHKRYWLRFAIGVRCVAQTGINRRAGARDAFGGGRPGSRVWGGLHAGTRHATYPCGQSESA
jgi:hypothetical protein